MFASVTLYLSKIKCLLPTVQDSFQPVKMLQICVFQPPKISSRWMTASTLDLQHVPMLHRCFWVFSRASNALQSVVDSMYAVYTAVQTIFTDLPTLFQLISELNAFPIERPPAYSRRLRSVL